MTDSAQVFQGIDALDLRIRRYAIEPEFSKDIAWRERDPDFTQSDDFVLETMIHLIAFSQQAPASRIVDMIHRGVFKDIFRSFDPATVAQMEPEVIRQQYWSRGLSPIRFRSKVDRMVDCAKSLEEIKKRYGSFMSYLQQCQFPERISSNESIESFWAAFERARLEMPSFFKNFTSLCHLLTAFGFPCAKPDRVVMSVAARLGIVAERKQYSEADQRKAIRLMQSYAARKRMRVPVVDLIFLIEGGQTDAKKFVDLSYYA